MRHDRPWNDKAWTQKHLHWIRTQKFAYPAQQCVLADYLKAVEDLAERVASLTSALEELVQETVLAPLVKALQAFRGISALSAITIAAEVGGDLRRFATAGQFMSYVGLTPSEDSSGKRRRQGAITRCGNGHLRRILVESAWHYRHAPAMSKELRRRNRGVADVVRRIAWEAQKRLHKRLYHLINAGKSSQKAVVALLRPTGLICLVDWSRGGSGWRRPKHSMWRTTHWPWQSCFASSSPRSFLTRGRPRMILLFSNPTAATTLLAAPIVRQNPRSFIMVKSARILVASFVVLTLAAGVSALAAEISQTTGPSKRHSVNVNRTPLAQNRFARLPFGSIMPEGWLKRQLQIEADGLARHLLDPKTFDRVLAPCKAERRSRSDLSAGRLSGRNHHACLDDRR